MRINEIISVKMLWKLQISLSCFTSTFSVPLSQILSDLSIQIDVRHNLPQPPVLQIGKLRTGNVHGMISAQSAETPESRLQSKGPFC